jgi:hypothetical protein
VAENNWGARVDEADTNNGVFGAGYGSDGYWFAPVPYKHSDHRIFELRTWVSNQQPAHISALADQFHNAHVLLTELDRAVRAPSERLYSETWTNSNARDAFMQRGPGRVLAYISDWEDQIMRSETALRMIIEPIRSSQTRMEILWNEYRAKVAERGDPNNLSFGDQVEAAHLGPLDAAFGVVGIGYKLANNEGGQKEILARRVQEVMDEYDQKARDLVDELSNAYLDAMTYMSTGIGASYEPPNVVMVPPGQEFPMPPAIPNVPAAFAGTVPAMPNVAPPPALGLAPLPPMVGIVPPTAPVAPSVPVPPTAPGLPNGPNAVPPAAPAAPNLPGVPNAGNLPGGLNPGLAAGLLPGAVPGGLGAPSPGLQPGALPVSAVPRPAGFNGLAPPPLGKGLTKGVLRKPGAAPGFGMTPPPAVGGSKRRRAAQGSTLRSPAANYTATGAPGVPGVPGGTGMLPPGAAQNRRRQASGVTGPTTSGATGVPDAFAQGTMPPPVAPVLGRPAPRRREERPAQPGLTRGTFAAPDAAPSVLDARTAMSRPGGLPLPPGAPGQRRTRRDAAGGPGAAGQPGMPLLPGGIPPGRRPGVRRARDSRPNLVGNPDWMAETGPDGTASTAPVLRNQVGAHPDAAAAGTGMMLPTQPGATAPVLGRSREAVRRAMAQNRTRPGVQRQAADENELMRRAREDYFTRGDSVAAREGEEAFTVQTPGGAVVGGVELPTPEPAPRPST